MGWVSYGSREAAPQEAGDGRGCAGPGVPAATSCLGARMLSTMIVLESRLRKMDHIKSLYQGGRERKWPLLRSLH